MAKHTPKGLGPRGVVLSDLGLVKQVEDILDGPRGFRCRRLLSELEDPEHRSIPARAACITGPVLLKNMAVHIELLPGGYVVSDDSIAAMIVQPEEFVIWYERSGEG